MTIARTTVGINKAGTPAQRTANHVNRCVAAGLADDAAQPSPVSWLDQPGDFVRLKFSNI